MRAEDQAAELAIPLHATDSIDVASAPAGEDGIGLGSSLEGAEGLDEDWEDPLLDCEGLCAPAEDEPEIRQYHGGPLEPGFYYAAPNGEIMIREDGQPPRIFPPGD